MLIEVLGVALIDLGRVDEAIRRVAAGHAAAPDYRGQGQLLWVLAEAALWGGRPARALDLIEEYLGRPAGDPNLRLGQVTHAWACVETGRDLRAGGRPLGDVSPARRAALFLGGWRGAAPGRRCGGRRRATADGGEDRGGDRAAAVPGQDPPLPTGGRPAPLGATVQPARRADRPRAPGTGTGQGWSHQLQIATQLGITQRTVAALVASASAEPGAANRSHAAALAAREMT